MTRPRIPSALQLLIVLGLAIAFAPIVLHLAAPKTWPRVEILPVVVGFSVALFCAYWIDPKRAKQSADGVTHAGADVVHSVNEYRMGARKDDPQVRVETTVSKVVPPPDEPPPVERSLEEPPPDADGGR